MSFKDLIGQDLAVTLLKRWHHSGHLTGPLLFYGPEAVGKRKAAKELAKTLLCGQAARLDSDFDACGVCAVCRQIDADSFPDVTFVNLATQAVWRGEPPEKQLSLRLETLQKAREILWKTPQQAKRKVMILEDIHLMTGDAANCLLKTLEEPPEDAMIILLTPFRDRMPSTILSRCQAIRFRGLTREERSKMHMKDPERRAAREEAESLWEKRKSYSRAQMLQHGKALMDDLKKGPAVEKWLGMMLEDAAEDLQEGDLAALPDAEALLKATRTIRRRVTPGLALDNLLLEIRKNR